MKNRIDDLRDHLFESLERLKEADGESLEQELTRAKAISETAGKLIDSAKVEVQYLEVTGQIEGSRFLKGAPALNGERQPGITKQ
ncbi:hypothetical protein [Sediminicurvatus halobius]|uniref:Uncharacterized protein n=1 Tax=Sediminicurvatus halobius TaxID=2182432 RepID=A0A2U2MXY3_9GAMM|nr:hypothetical protein [Spiribacter halobius]PWG61730.1 hypothetical protein DEM34_14785 [Spiribacter halobius]UEX76842.1 hypothetical protein LMH63_12840 [Spiribacter halobius]